MTQQVPSPRIKCPIILSAFNVGGERKAERATFDFSVINLFDEFSQPSVPYYRHSVDYAMISETLAELNENIDKIDNNKLRDFGRLFWNTLLPPQVRQYLTALDQEYAIELLLMTNDIDIPWEIVHDDSDFWALKYSIGRIYGMSESTVSLPRKGRKTSVNRPPVLLITDPAQNLEGARKEGEVLRVKLQDSFEVTAFQGRLGRRGLKIAIGSNQHDIIHFAGHAEMGKSAALLAADGGLEADDIAGISLARNPIVFANACSTAAGGCYYGANSRNIAHAFIKAGAAAFIGTLWKTNDELCADFASAMYERLKAGGTIGDSLLRARLDLYRRRGPTDIDWAAFALFGNPDSRLYRHAPVRDLVSRRVQITMSNASGSLGRILVALSELDVNIVQGRSITFDDEETAGYVAEMELPPGVVEGELRNGLEKSAARELIRNIRFVN